MPSYTLEKLWLRLLYAPKIFGMLWLAKTHPGYIWATISRTPKYTLGNVAKRQRSTRNRLDCVAMYCWITLHQWIGKQ